MRWGGGKYPFPTPAGFGYTVGNVPVSSYLILFLGFALEIAIAWRLAKDNLWRNYSLFALYVLFIFAQGCLGFILLRHSPASYAEWYWRTGIVGILLRFVLIWEIFRHAFPESSALRQMMSRQFVTKILALIGVASGMLWVYQTYGERSVYLAMERSFGFVQAALVLAVFALARYYNFHLERTSWGIAVAFGLYCSLSTIASAALELAHWSLFPYWYLLSPLSFVAMLGVWTWAVWTHAAGTVLQHDGILDPATELGAWSESWGRTVSTVRKVSNL